MENINQVINHNIKIISTLKEEEYPELTALRRRATVIRHLYDLMQHMLSYSAPLWPLNNKRYFLFSKSYLADWNKANGGSGDASTWQSHKTFLLHAGLIKTFSVTYDQQDPVLHRIWETAKCKGYRSETLWTVPLYTSNVLKRAERIALEYRENHVNLSHITKNTIARVWGQRTADKLYRSSKHIISSEQRFVEQCLQKAIQDALSIKGYTTVDEMCNQSLDLCLKTGNGSRKEYKKIIKCFLEQKRLMINRAGCEYHRIRNEDRRLPIPADHKGFIITKKE